MNILELEECRVVRQAIKVWTSDNSVVRSTPSVDVSAMQGAFCLKSVGASLVVIAGPSREELHFHISHLWGVVVSGEGSLRYRRKGQTTEMQMRIGESDLIVIPRGVFHLFECEEGKSMAYIALEVSDGDIDYQKHWR